jgi:hypothetical protein
VPSLLLGSTVRITTPDVKTTTAARALRAIARSNTGSRGSSSFATGRHNGTDYQLHAAAEDSSFVDRIAVETAMAMMDVSEPTNGADCRRTRTARAILQDRDTCGATRDAPVGARNPAHVPDLLLGRCPKWFPRPDPAYPGASVLTASKPVTPSTRSFSCMLCGNLYGTGTRSRTDRPEPRGDLADRRSSSVVYRDDRLMST